MGFKYLARFCVMPVIEQRKNEMTGPYSKSRIGIEKIGCIEQFEIVCEWDWF